MVASKAVTVGKIDDNAHSISHKALNVSGFFSRVECMRSLELLLLWYHAPLLFLPISVTGQLSGVVQKLAYES